MTRSVGALSSNSWQGVESASPLAATTSHPFDLASTSVVGRDRQEYTVIFSRAPLLALDTTPLRGAEFLLQMSTPSAPRKNAVRMTAPRFCGSVISSRQSQTGQEWCGRYVSTGGITSSFSQPRGLASRTIPWWGRLLVAMLRSCFEVSTSGMFIFCALASACLMAGSSFLLESVIPSWTYKVCRTRLLASRAARTGDEP
mmetsp:Transcript_228/g.557  ORF Transcript_228/g.557 Transcript_228/m.557 type:complete len:200 (+) Transcript_228:1557-2156(+)